MFKLSFFGWPNLNKMNLKGNISGLNHNNVGWIKYQTSISPESVGIFHCRLLICRII